MAGSFSAQNQFFLAQQIHDITITNCRSKKIQAQFFNSMFQTEITLNGSNDSPVKLVHFQLRINIQNIITIE